MSISIGGVTCTGRAARFICLFALAQACWAPLGRAQTAQFEGRTIAAIQYEPAQPLASEDLANAQPLKVGAPLRAADVGTAIDGLFATGRFEDIVVDAEPSGDGVSVRFQFKLTRFVGGITLQTASPNPPNRAQVELATEMTIGTPFHDEDVTKAVDNLYRLLSANGFYEAKVNASTSYDDTAQQVFLSLTIQTGKRAKYAQPVIHGSPMLSDASILRVTGWRFPIIHWWRKVTASRTQGGVSNLLQKYAGKDRLRAKVEITNLNYDAAAHRVHPELNIDPGPEVKVTTLETKVSRRVLKRYVPVFSIGAVDNDLLTEGKRNLTDYFQSQGYYDVNVEFRVQDAKDGVQRIEYVISRGMRFKLVKLTLTGNRYFDEPTIRERMLLAPASFGLWHGRYSEAFLRKDEQNIQLLYQASGFRDAKVTATVQRNYRGKAGDMALTLHIDEGRQWVVDHLVIKGADAANIASFRPQLSSGEGEPFSEALLAVDRQTVLTWYFTHGYPDATFATAWNPSDAPRRINVAYTISEGQRQYVRDIKISGLTTTRRSVVDKQITLHPGDPLSPLQVTDIQKKLYDLGVFANVNAAIQNDDGSTSRKYVLYNFQEANRYTLALGVGAQVARFGQPSSTSLGSPAGTTGFSPEFSVTATRTNFLGIGHMISARLDYSNIEKRASLNYLQPRFRNSSGRTLTYTLLYDNTRDVRTFAAKREEASVQLTQKFSKTLNGLFRFSYRRVSVSSIVIPVLLIPQLVQPVRVGMLSMNLVQDRRDNPADPHRGMFNTADIGLADSVFGSQRDFGRILLRNATYYALTHNLVLARQTQIGVIYPFSPPTGISAAESVPLPERFFSGGADSVRGFAYNEAGPRDTGVPLTPAGPGSPATGFPLGGNALFVNNIELRFPVLKPNLQGVLFHDIGNVYTDIQHFSLRYRQNGLKDFNYAVQDLGLGVRYRTPIGPVRADFAYALNPPSFVGFKGTPLQLLQCGPDAPAVGACASVQQNTGHFQFFFSIGQTF